MIYNAKDLDQYTFDHELEDIKYLISVEDGTCQLITNLYNDNNRTIFVSRIKYRYHNYDLIPVSEDCVRIVCRVDSFNLVDTKEEAIELFVSEQARLEESIKAFGNAYQSVQKYNLDDFMQKCKDNVGVCNFAKRLADKPIPSTLKETWQMLDCLHNMRVNVIDATIRPNRSVSDASFECSGMDYDEISINLNNVVSCEKCINYMHVCDTSGNCIIFETNQDNLIATQVLAYLFNFKDVFFKTKK